VKIVLVLSKIRRFWGRLQSVYFTKEYNSIKNYPASTNPVHTHVWTFIKWD